MLAASCLFLVSVLSPSWSLLGPRRDQQESNKSMTCPSIICGHAVEFPTRDAASSDHRTDASAFLFSQGQSCPTCRVFGIIRPVLGVWISGSRGEAPGINVSASKAHEASFCARGYSGSANPFFVAICA